MTLTHGMVSDFERALLALATEHGYEVHHRYVHRSYCTAHKSKHCSCVGRNEIVLVNSKSEDEERARVAQNRV